VYNYNSGEELAGICHRLDKPIWEVMLLREMENSGQPREIIYGQMEDNLDTMFRSVEKGFSQKLDSTGGLIGGDAMKLKDRWENRRSFSGSSTLMAVAGAMSVLEVNASMGLIVAAPTAGASGIIPGVLFAVREKLSPTKDQMIHALFTCAAIGLVIAKNATISGAEGGCQAETGSAAAMMVGALVEMEGGTPEASLHGAAIALKNVMGLVCDPIAGLVECPCQKRNAIGATNAMICADMALAGIESIIPFDEVVETMARVGRQLHPNLKETARGGLAITPTGLRLAEKIFGPNR